MDHQVVVLYCVSLVLSSMFGGMIVLGTITVPGAKGMVLAAGNGG